MQVDVPYTRDVVLQPHVDAHPCVRQLNRKTRHHLLRLRLAGNQAVGKQTRPLTEKTLFDGAVEILLALCIYSQSLQNSFLCVG